MNTTTPEEDAQEGTRNRKRPVISLVEGSFRRIAGIREFADGSGTFVVRRVEILREPGKSLGFYVQQGDGWERKDGVFVSRVNLGSIVETNGLLSIGDEITGVNDIDVTQMPLESVAVIMRYVERLFLTVKVLTSPALLRTYSQRKYHQANAPSRAAMSQQRGSPSPSSKKRIIVDRGGVEPYAYTRIEIRSAQEDKETVPDYELVCPPTQRDQTPPTESPTTLGSTQDEEFQLSEIDYDHIDQTLNVQAYSGQLKLTLDSIDNLIPVSNDAPLLCTVLCDSELRLELSIPADQLDKAMVSLSHKYHILLNQTHRVNFKFINGLLSSMKTIPLSFFVPMTKETNPPQQEFALNLDPIGRLRFTLEFSPLPIAIPRWSYPSTHAISLKEAVASNPSSSGLPLVLEQTVRVIEEYGIETAGLYQINASQEAKAEAHEACLGETLQPSLLRCLVSSLSVHAFTGVLVDFFLALPEPIFSSELTPTLQDALCLAEGKNNSNQKEQAASSGSIIQGLPDHVHATIYALLTHFRNVCQYGHTNKTTVDKISQIFSPLLFTPANTDQHNATECNSDYTSQAHILRALILQQK